MGNEVCVTSTKSVEEPCEGKLSRTVLETSGSREGLAEFNKFLATSDGVLVKQPKFFKKLQSQLQLLQRRLSRKLQASKNYEKQRIKVARIYHKIDNTRKDFHFKQAHALCDSAALASLRASAGDMVFMEDLDYRTSAKGMFGKHMLDAAFGQFRTIVKYVCWKRGKFCRASTLARFANSEVDAFGTSQECPECGGEARKDLSVRVHSCPPKRVYNR